MGPSACAVRWQSVVDWEGACAQAFPVFRDRMPVQLLAYLRLARLTDTGMLAKVGQRGA